MGSVAVQMLTPYYTLEYPDDLQADDTDLILSSASSDCCVG